MRAKWRSPRRAGSSVLKKALDTPNIVRDGRIVGKPYKFRLIFQTRRCRKLGTAGHAGWFTKICKIVFSLMPQINRTVPQALTEGVSPCQLKTHRHLPRGWM